MLIHFPGKARLLVWLIVFDFSLFVGILVIIGNLVGFFPMVLWWRISLKLCYRIFLVWIWKMLKILSWNCHGLGSPRAVQIIRSLCCLWRISCWQASSIMGSFKAYHQYLSVTSWMVVGDFNQLLQPQDKQGGVSPNMSQILHFRDCIQCLQLTDLGYKGTHITWKRGDTFERLDRAFYTYAWSQSFNHATLPHLSFTSASDHCPLLLDMGT